MMAALARPPSLRARGRAMLHLLFDTGIRASELADIRLGDLDLEAGVLRVRGKGSQRQRVKWRTVGMGVRAQRAVQQYAFRHRPPAIPVGKDRVFLTRDGRRMTRNTVHRFVKRLGRSAGVERAPPPLVPALDGRGVPAQRRVGERASADPRARQPRDGGALHASGRHGRDAAAPAPQPARPSLSSVTRCRVTRGVPDGRTRPVHEPVPGAFDRHRGSVVPSAELPSFRYGRRSTGVPPAGGR